MNLLQAALMALPLTALAAACLSSPVSVPSLPRPTVTITVSGAGARQITCTDPLSPNGVRYVTMSPRTPASFQVTVPKGTTVTVRLSDCPDQSATQCSIGDETGQLVYAWGRDSCTHVAN